MLCEAVAEHAVPPFLVVVALRTVVVFGAGVG